MSIIQDALKRKAQEEAARPEPEPAPVPAPKPAPPPPAPRADVRAAPGPAPVPYPERHAPAPVPARRGARWLVPVLLVLLLVGVTAMAAWFFLDYRGESTRWASRAESDLGASNPLIPPEAAPVEPDGGLWPAVECGSLALAGKNSSAFLNGELIFLGEDIDGAVLVDVQAKGVTLENEAGERRFLKQGDRIP